MSNLAKVAVVTGSNRGIGLSIVKGLIHELGPNGIVYLTGIKNGFFLI